MRENNLLSPHRVRQAPPVEHTGKITTDAPNLMWGSDGTKVYTLDDGWVWIFSAVEHWNTECVGWHVCKKGDRYAALMPFSMGLKRIFGNVGKEVATGLKARIDHGPQYTADHFTNQLKFWGIEPSFAFVHKPQTNGVAERFNRTLKEQAINGRIFRNVKEVREAVGTFVELYNEHWRPEKLGYLTPNEARNNYGLAMAA